MNALGKYLSVPLTGKSPNRKDFEYMVNRVKAKLMKWKSNQLSLAGRITLAMSFSKAIPIYPMMTYMLRNIVWRRFIRFKRSSYGGIHILIESII